MVTEVGVEFKANDATRAVSKGDLIIVIDVLRFGSSVLNAFANGVQEIVPVRTLKEAYDMRLKQPDCLLAGERRGVKPRGFDLGNSPLEFIKEKVSGRRLIFTTTSGTQALTRSKEAKWILVGVFLNASQVATRAFEIAHKEAIGISLVQSGTKGQFSLEDFISAGAIIDRLPLEKVTLSDASYAALLAYRRTQNNLCKIIMETEHAKNLTNLGLREDIEFSCQIDLLPVVPTYRDGIINLLR